MRKVVLYMAVSLDGYIADSKGAVDWISGQDESAEMEDRKARMMLCQMICWQQERIWLFDHPE